MYMWTPGQMRPTFNKWSFPPEARVQMSKCLVNRKHCLSPSFLSERDPRRTLLSTPRSLLDGSWMREPGSGGVMKGRESAVHLKLSWLKAETDVVESAHLVWQRFDWCPTECHSLQLSSSLWQGSALYSLCRSLHHASSWWKIIWNIVITVTSPSLLSSIHADQMMDTHTLTAPPVWI